ncbi:MAG: hypothetical protein EHM61_28380 [Acidobacteria bacterium]|nr:MAG: hypothetical protein EHM61_28380 [Acidobacteriota bacterium]
MLQKTESPKTGSVLLVIGGVFQALFAIMHVGMFFGISRDPALPAAMKPLLYIFNAAVLATVLFFAYASFFRRRELLETGLGRVTCLFIGAFYVQRALVDTMVNSVNTVFLGLLSLVAAFYLLAPFTPRRAVAGHTTEGVALGAASSK